MGGGSQGFRLLFGSQVFDMLDYKLKSGLLGVFLNLLLGKAGVWTCITCIYHAAFGIWDRTSFDE